MKNLIKFNILLLLAIPFHSSGQIEIQTGFGHGYVLGAPNKGYSIQGDLTYSLKKRFKLRGVGVFFKSDEGKFAAGDYGPTIVESTLSNPIPIFLTEWEKKEFREGWKTLPSTTFKVSYAAFNLELGYSIIDKDKSKLTFFAGGSIAKYDKVYTPTTVTATIDIGPFGTYDADLHSVAYVTYLDLGFSFALQYKYYVYKTFSIGAEMAANRYSYSDDGFFYGAIKLGISM